MMGAPTPLAEIIRSIKDERIRLIYLDRGGLCATLNRGTREARAPYIARSDHDDISYPTRLERQLQVMKEHPDAIAVFSFNSKFGKKHRWGNSDKFSLESNSVREYNPERDGCMLASTMFARTDSLLAMGGFRQPYWPCDDIDLQFRMSEAGEVLVLCEPLVDYRFHLGAVSYAQFQKMQLLANWARDSRQRRMRNEPEITYEEFLNSLPSDLWSRLTRQRIFLLESICGWVASGTLMGIIWPPPLTFQCLLCSIRATLRDASGASWPVSPSLLALILPAAPRPNLPAPQKELPAVSKCGPGQRTSQLGLRPHRRMSNSERPSASKYGHNVIGTLSALMPDGAVCIPRSQHVRSESVRSL